MSAHARGIVPELFVSLSNTRNHKEKIVLTPGTRPKPSISSCLNWKNLSRKAFPKGTSGVLVARASCPWASEQSSHANHAMAHNANLGMFCAVLSVQMKHHVPVRCTAVADGAHGPAFPARHV